ncbi:hypothetical protein QVA66_05055 [Staphylococcus chromogenes]|nr:hypothetical protein [Staphylococcus chromogenes]
MKKLLTAAIIATTCACATPVAQATTESEPQTLNLSNETKVFVKPSIADLSSEDTSANEKFVDLLLLPFAPISVWFGNALSTNRLPVELS